MSLRNSYVESVCQHKKLARFNTVGLVTNVFAYLVGKNTNKGLKCARGQGVSRPAAWCYSSAMDYAGEKGLLDVEIL
jgi:hypothetical protein